MKLVIYAIAKDEEGVAQRWAESVKEADEVVVLDTGSTDRTREILRGHGITVHEDYTGPFRFDRARNQALSHVPEDADWCFSVDLDEVFEPGWRSAIEQAAQANPLATQIKYPFVFSHRINPHTGKEEPDLLFYKGNCHRRHGWKWVCPCHEVIISDTQPIEATAEGCVLHHRSPMKQRREGYLALLEQGAKDEPNNARNLYYLGREYLRYGRYQEAGDTLVRFIDLAGQYCWHDEKGDAIYMIAQSCAALGDLDRAESWALRALAETEGREPYVFLAQLYYHQERWWEAMYYANRAVEIENNNTFFRNPNHYRAEPWDYMGIAAFKLGDRDRAKQAAEQCLLYEPDNERYKQNALFFGVTQPERPKTPENGEIFDSRNHASASEISGDKTAEARESGPELAVAYSITRNYAEHLEVGIYKLLKHNRVRDLYIIIEGGEPVPSISRLARRFGVNRTHWINLDVLLETGLGKDCPNTNPICTPATLGRLFLARNTEEERIIYLDADTLVHGSLADLWHQDLTGAALVGVIDRGALNLPEVGDYTKSLIYGGIPGYLNAGVLLMNLDLIRTQNLDTHALKLLNTHRYQFADQDVLNIACRNKTRSLGPEWNSGGSCGFSNTPVIEHFVSVPDFYKNPNCRSWQAAKQEYALFFGADSNTTSAAVTRRHG